MSAYLHTCMCYIDVCVCIKSKTSALCSKTFAPLMGSDVLRHTGSDSSNRQLNVRNHRMEGLKTACFRHIPGEEPILEAPLIPYTHKLGFGC